MEPPCMLCEEDQEPEPQKSVGETKQVDDEDAELIFVGVEHVNEDADLIFVGMTSTSKPVVSNILNRVTPGSCSRRKRYGHFRKDNTHKLQPVSHVNPTSEAKSVLPVSDSESRSTANPIIIDPLSEADYKNISPQIVPNSFSELLETAVSAGDMNKSPHVSKQLSTSETNSTNPKRPKLSDGIIREYSLTLSPSGIFHTLTTEQSTPDSVHTSLSHVQNGEPFPTAFPRDNVHCKPVSPLGENGLKKTDFPSLASQNKITVDPMKGNLVMLLDDFYYGQHTGDGQPEPKTHTTFKCLSCLRVLKNVKFMTHVRNHLELERQKSDGWEIHTTCRLCHRQFPTPFQLQCHIESVHAPREPSAVCKICELYFETDQLLLQHMKDSHKPGEMPYVCRACNYRSSAFADVEAHFRTWHGNTNNLLCLLCLRIFKLATSFVNHARRHWNKRVFPCSKCWLQFLNLKEKAEHQAKHHQSFKTPEQLRGLPPETEVTIRTSVQLGLRETASITVRNMDSQVPKATQKKRHTFTPLMEPWQKEHCLRVFT
uniref:C2H2-type domain-containing protein n=1 Tax=Capra hircus TaxID=9925 RepID=A0A8C2S1D6_CAPHI